MQEARRITNIRTTAPRLAAQRGTALHRPSMKPPLPCGTEATNAALLGTLLCAVVPDFQVAQNGIRPPLGKIHGLTSHRQYLEDDDKFLRPLSSHSQTRTLPRI